MNKLLVALIAGVFATVAAAQTAAPAPAAAAPMAAPAAAAPLTTKEKQDAVKAATQAGSGSSASTQKTAAEGAKNTAVSKTQPKMTTADKNMAIKDVNKKQVNPDNSAGAGATATMQKETTAASTEVPKMKTNLNTPEAQKALEKASTK